MSVFSIVTGEGVQYLGCLLFIHLCCGHAGWPQCCPLPDLHADTEVTLWGRGQTVQPLPLSRTAASLHVRRPSSLTQRSAVCCLTSGEPWGPLASLWIKALTWLESFDLPALEIPLGCVLGKSRRQIASISSFFLCSLTNLSFCQCCHKGLPWPVQCCVSLWQYAAVRKLGAWECLFAFIWW